MAVYNNFPNDTLSNYHNWGNKNSIKPQNAKFVGFCFSIRLFFVLFSFFSCDESFDACVSSWVCLLRHTI